MTRPLELSHVGIQYGRRSVLRDVSLSVNPGEIYALLGRNGEGKTSLVRSALGWQKAQGEIRLFGLPAWTSRREAMTRIGVVEEHPSLPPHFTVEDVLGWCQRVRRRERHALTSSRLDRAGISMRSTIQSLSRGQKAQLAMALALAHEPELLVLDDPTLGLDPVARRGFFETLVSEMADGRLSVFLTSHDLGGVEGVADRVGILRGGRLLMDESVEALKARMRRLRWPGSSLSPLVEKMQPLRLEASSFGAEAVVAGFTDEAFALAQQAIPQLTAEPLALEDAFIALVDGEKEVRA